MSLWIDQREKGLPSTVGRVVAVWTVLVVTIEKAETAYRPPRVKACEPDVVEPVDHIADGVLVRLARRAITGTVQPPAEASSIIARRNRTELVLPRRTMC